MFLSEAGSDLETKLHIIKVQMWALWIFVTSIIARNFWDVFNNNYCEPSNCLHSGAVTIL